MILSIGLTIVELDPPFESTSFVKWPFSYEHPLNGLKHILILVPNMVGFTCFVYKKSCSIDLVLLNINQHIQINMCFQFVHINISTICSKHHT